MLGANFDVHRSFVVQSLLGYRLLIGTETDLHTINRQLWFETKSSGTVQTRHNSNIRIPTHINFKKLGESWASENPGIYSILVGFYL